MNSGPVLVKWQIDFAPCKSWSCLSPARRPGTNVSLHVIIILSNIILFIVVYVEYQLLGDGDGDANAFLFSFSSSLPSARRMSVCTLSFLVVCMSISE